MTDGVVYRTQNHLMMKPVTSPQRPLQRRHRVHLDLANHATTSPTAVAIFDQNPPYSPNMP